MGLQCTIYSLKGFVLPQCLWQTQLPQGSCIAVVWHCQGGILLFFVALYTDNLVFLLPCGTQQQMLLGVLHCLE